MCQNWKRNQTRSLHRLHDLIFRNKESSKELLEIMNSLTLQNTISTLKIQLYFCTLAINKLKISKQFHLQEHQNEWE